MTSTIVDYRGVALKTGSTCCRNIPHYHSRSQYVILIELVIGDAPLIRISPAAAAA